MVRVYCLVIGYIFGLFQTAYIIGRMHGIDIRNYGSGNSGTTNMMRTLGRKAGFATFAGDCLKCIAAIFFTRMLFRGTYPDMQPLLLFYTAAGVILGHNFPFYLGFRGGKGIAATAGLVISLQPVMTVLGIITFFGTVLLTGYVSLGSILVYVGIMIELPIFGQLGYFHMSQAHLNEMYVVALFLALMAFWQHRENIKRLLNHTERKASLLGHRNKDHKE